MSNEGLAVAEEPEERREVFPESVKGLIRSEAEKRIKKSAIYVCRNGHKFKGKDLMVEIFEEENVDAVVFVRFVCPECDAEEILIPNPVLVLDMTVE